MITHFAQYHGVMRMRLYPAISVHCWGGLGSQLYTLFLVNKLTTRFPRRRIKIVFHSGGVTKRLPEVLPLVENYSFQIIDDFKLEDSGVPKSKSPSNNFRSFFYDFLLCFAKRLLSKSGFLSSCENDEELTGLKPWILATRGHYSYLRVDPEFVTRIYRESFGKLTKPNPQLKDIHNSVCIHYRLGDLIALGSKSPTSPLRLSKVVDQLNNCLPVLILSDSPEIAAQELKKVNSNNEFTSAITYPWDAILQTVHAKIFVGTSSKISYWISIMRVCLFNSENTFMPIEDRNQLMMNLSKENFQKVKFYEI